MWLALPCKPMSGAYGSYCGYMLVMTAKRNQTDGDETTSACMSDQSSMKLARCATLSCTYGKYTGSTAVPSSSTSSSGMPSTVMVNMLQAAALMTRTSCLVLRDVWKVRLPPLYSLFTTTASGIGSSP